MEEIMAKQIIKSQDLEIEGELDLEVEEVRMEIPKPEVKRETNSFQTAAPKPEELISCLRNVKLIVRFIPKATALVQNPKHVLYGGLAENAFREYTVPRLASSGAYVNVLTNDEKNFLEDIMQLEHNALSIHKKDNNFWKDFKVRLGKSDTILDLSVPIDYIKYKVLKSNNDFIAGSLDELEEKPKVTYQFVLIAENEESKSGIKRLSYAMQAYMLLGQIKDDKDTLRTIVEMLEGKPIGTATPTEVLLSKINDFISSDSKQVKTFLTIAEDKLLPVKVLIKKAVEAGLVAKRGTYYYNMKDNSPLCDNGEDPTIVVAAKYLNQPKHQELKLMLEAKTSK